MARGLSSQGAYDFAVGRVVADAFDDGDALRRAEFGIGTGGELLKRDILRDFSACPRRALRHFWTTMHSAAPQEWLDTAASDKKSFKTLTVNFLRDWNSAICRGASQNELDDLVKKQAIANKPGRSLLVRKPTETSDWYGMKELDYRWPTARRMLLDITEAH